MTLNWIIGYLSERRQRLTLNTEHSRNLNNNVGLPWESALRLLLFIFNWYNRHGYNMDIGLEVVNTTPERLYRYCTNILKVNFNKAKILSCKNNCVLENKSDLQESNIENVEKIICLGVTVDSQLKFKKTCPSSDQKNSI